MKKSKFIISLAMLPAFILAGCANGGADRAPTLAGVKDISCLVNSPVDLLQSVAALDREDGDITPRLAITVKPQTEVADGYAFFTATGEYEVKYSVTDSAGNVAEDKATVEVTEREIFKNFNALDGFYCATGGGATVKRCGDVNGVFRLEATGGEIAEDIRLTRDYALNGGVDYTFIYDVQSNLAGRIKVLAGGVQIDELEISEGGNEIRFTHKTAADLTGETEIELCLGNLGEVDWTINSVSVEYPQEKGLIEQPLQISLEGRFDQTEGRVEASADGKGAILEISKAGADNWRGGVFISTGISLSVGDEFEIAFNTASENDSPYDVCIQRAKWADEVANKIEVIDTMENLSAGFHKKEIKINENTTGNLILYLRSGAHLNKVTLSGLCVKKREAGGFKREYLATGDFTEKHEAGFNSEFSTDCGKFTYKIESFSATDWHHEVTSPEFLLSGSPENYVITFRASSTRPIEIIFTAPGADGNYDNNLVWERVYLSQGEGYYTFYGKADAAQRARKLIWQFGAAANQRYNNVTVEVSEIKISYKNTEFDKE